MTTKYKIMEVLEEVSNEGGWEMKDNTEIASHFGTDETCVEKASETISILKQHLLQWRSSQPRGSSRNSGISPGGQSATNYSRLNTPSVLSHHQSTVSFADSEMEQLVVKGKRTGQSREARSDIDWTDAEHVISHVLNLVTRLEKDREFTVARWIEEREKVKKMRTFLDQKAIERLKILPVLVQQEHERFLKDVMELKWHISFENRHLSFIRDEVKIVSDINQEYIGELSRTGDLLHLLQDKLDIEGDKMAKIIRKQGEADVELKQCWNDLKTTTEKTFQTRTSTEAEMRSMNKELKDYQDRVNDVLEALAAILGEQEELNKTIDMLKLKISSLEDETKNKSETLESMKKSRTNREDQVLSLIEKRQEKEEETSELVARNAGLKKKKEEKFSSLDSTDSVLTSEIQKLSRELKAVRRKNEDLQDEIDETKEQTAASLKGYDDDVRAIERARRELGKIDKQLQVVLFQTDSVRTAHRELLEEFKNEEFNLGSIEDSLRTGLQAIKQEFQKEQRTKIVYQGKIQEDKADLDKIVAEHQHLEEKTRKKAEDIELRKQESISRAAALDVLHQTKYKEEASLRKLIDETRAELARIESSLGGNFSMLAEEKNKLDTEVAEKGERLLHLNDQKKMLNDKIDDTSKGTKMVKRMETDVVGAIEELENKRDSLQQEIEKEKDEEQSWKDELQDITVFSQQSKEKYTHYLIEREKYLIKLEQDEIEAAEQNRSLAKKYDVIREEHFNMKATTLHILEHQLELEAALKDIGQLLALQIKLSTTMAASYKHRSTKGIKDLNDFKHRAMTSTKQLTDAHTGLEVVLNGIDRFLNIHKKEQSDLIFHRHRHNNQEIRMDNKLPSLSTETHNKLEKPDNKTVSFATPMVVQCK